MERMQRQISTLERRFALLAPLGADLRPFHCTIANSDQRAHLLRAIQRMRGSVYAEDGAVKRHELTADGLHRLAEDDRSWHLFARHVDGSVTGSLFVLPHGPEVSFSTMRLGECPLASNAAWRDKLAAAVESEISQAHRECMQFGELGGWAITKDSRGTADALLLALGAFALGRLLGGFLAITTATVRHSSSRILRRIGGAALQSDGGEIPSYHDSRYECLIELLRFDCRHPSKRFEAVVRLLQRKLVRVPVFSWE